MQFELFWDESTYTIVGGGEVLWLNFSELEEKLLATNTFLEKSKYFTSKVDKFSS